MKVLLISTFETKGGAAVACKRLAIALQKEGIDVSMLVRDKATADSFVSGANSSPLKVVASKAAFLAERMQIFLTNSFKRKNLFSVSTASTGIRILENPLVKEADIIHLHWINQGLLSVGEIKELTKLGKPIIWTMHDMWPVTGICHYSGNCNYYMKNCGNCRLLQRPFPTDLSYRVFNKKKDSFLGAGVHFVACSHWLLQKAKVSGLRNGNFFTSIPNAIDIERYCPGDQILARKKLGLPLDKKLILFGAFALSDKRKGFDYLIKATHLLADLKQNVEIVFCGEMKDNSAEALDLHAHYLGYLSDPEKMVDMYRSVDCFVLPSLEENLPNMIMEAMACGIPCVGFDTGGIPEMILHQQTGYVAKYKSANDLAFGIRSILEKSGDSAIKKENRDYITRNYSEKIIAQRYIQLYTNALKNDDATNSSH